MRFRSISFALACVLLAPAGGPAEELEYLFDFGTDPDGAPPDGWIAPPGLGLWEVEAGELSGEAPVGGQEAWIWLDQVFEGDITIEVKVRFVATPGDVVGRHGGIAFFGTFPVSPARRWDSMTGYVLDWIDRAQDHGVRLDRWNGNGTETGLLPSQLADVDPAETWRIEVRGPKLTIFMDDQFFYEVEEPTYRSGMIGFWAYQNGNHMHFDDLRVTNPKIKIRREIPDALQNGGSGRVTLTAIPLAPGVLALKEELPAELTPSAPSPGGVLAGKAVEWNVSFTEVGVETVLSYTLAAGEDANDGPITATGTYSGEPVNVHGDVSYTGSPFTVDGFVKLWNHLGPLAFSFPPAANDHGGVFPTVPGACNANDGLDLSLDWIVNADRSVTESGILPFPGMVTRPAYGGTGLPGGNGARAAGLVTAPGDTGEVVQDRFPVWRGTLTRGDTIFHAGPDVTGFDAEDHLTMSCVYIENPGPDPIVTQIGLASDDSIQVLLNNEDVTLGGIIDCRGYGLPGEVQNTVDVILPVGESRLLVKVADGCCASGFRLRFEDPRDPLAPGLKPPVIRARLESARNRRPADVVRSIPGGTFASGEVEVALAASTRAAGDLAIREVLPAGARVVAGSITDGGTLSAGAIEWNLQAVTQKTVSYRMAAEACAPELRFGQSSFVMGGMEAVVTGPDVLVRSFPDAPSLGTWDNRDIGAAGGGVEKLGDHAVLVRGPGAGLRLQRDSFRFISQPSIGDYELTAAIECINDPAARGTAGVMVRNTLNEDSANMYLGLSPRLPAAGPGVGTLVASYRRDTGKTTLNFPIGEFTDEERRVERLPIHLRIKRTGGVVSLGRRYADEPTYTDVVSREIGVPTDVTKIVLADDPRLGLAATATGGPGVLAHYQDVSGAPFTVQVPPPDPPVLVEASTGNGTVDLRWTAPAAGTPPTAYVILRDGARLTEVPATQLTHTDGGLTNGVQYCYRVRAKAATVEGTDSNQRCATPGVGKLFRRGDLNTDQSINLTDAINLLGALFLGQPELATCRDAADVDDSGNLNLTDAIYLLSYSFQGGDEPPAPGPKICGLDPSVDVVPGGDLGCLSEVTCVSRP